MNVWCTYLWICADYWNIFNNFPRRVNIYRHAPHQHETNKKIKREHTMCLYLIWLKWHGIWENFSFAKSFEPTLIALTMDQAHLFNVWLRLRSYFDILTYQWNNFALVSSKYFYLLILLVLMININQNLFFIVPIKFSA